MDEHNKPNASMLQVAKAVLAAFIGIRKKDDLENDAANIKPSQVIIGGLIGGAIFVVTILFVVKIIVN
ncbi:MAG: DUF2970 domain-containing protein [Nitrosomonas sp.]|nr:DUF2970 domain-containing protein [Nitrosomonas sp.]MCW5607528.1 DUF2970 domain-containing protein [Nitrosomonas sp.]